jgi:hypothetical protein
VLVETEPGEVAVEALAVVGGGEVAVFHAPVGDRANDAVDELADAVLALGRADFAVEVFAADDVGRELRPEGGDFAVGLLEEDFAVLALDGGGADFPLDRVEDIGAFRWAERGVDLQAAVEALGGGGTGMSASRKRSVGHRHNKPPVLIVVRRASVLMYMSTLPPC